MKKRNNIYFILTYLFFIYPPFIWGLVMIYRERNFDMVHITSLYINLILLGVIALICGLLVYLKKIHVPSELEIKYLLFGLIGNIVVYFYTFQNLMHIEDIVTIYLILLVVLLVHYFLISRTLKVIELWLLLPLFIVIDYIHLIYTGCGWSEGYECYQGSTDVFQYILYTILILASLAYYSYRVYLLKLVDYFKYINIALVAVMAVLIQDIELFDERIVATVGIMLAFFTIVDFVVSIVNKRYTHRILFFYIRMYTILTIFSVMGAMEFFQGNASYEILMIMVSITYVSLFTNIFRSLLKVDKEKIVKVNREIKFMSCMPKHVEHIKEYYGEMEANHVSLEENHYSLVATKGDEVVGFISTYIKPLTPPLEDTNEAYINIIEVHPEYRKQGIASRLTLKTEKHFKGLGISQIRGWSSDDKLEAINLWRKLDYLMSPALIHIEKANINVNGYYFVKKI